MSESIILYFKTGSPPYDCSVYIFREEDGRIIGTVVFRKSSQMFIPRIRDLDKGAWQDLLQELEKNGLVP